jgi:hypothetical protein
MGTPFNGASELAAIVAADPRLSTCPSEKLMSFALARILGPTDGPYVEQLTQTWDGGTLQSLVQALVASDTFRFRRLPAEAL